MLQYGANIDAEDTDKRTPLHLAVQYGILSLKIRAWTKNHFCIYFRRSIPSLNFLFRLGKEQIVTSLLQYGANIDAEDTEKKTPLYLATFLGIFSLKFMAWTKNQLCIYFAQIISSNCLFNLGEEQIAKELLRYGANVDAEDIDKNTPLHSASSLGRKQTFDLLLKYGANVNAKDSYKWTPLHLAAQTGRISLKIRAWTKNDLFIYFRKSISSSNFFFRLGEEQIVNSLLQNGANIHAEDIDKRTPLHSAAYFGIPSL